MDFQSFLKSKGWRRYYKVWNKKSNTFDKVESDSMSVSTYSHLGYFFSHEDYPEDELYWGLEEHGRPPTFIFSQMEWQATHSRHSLCQRMLAQCDNDTIYEAILNYKIIRYVNGKFEASLPRA